MIYVDDSKNRFGRMKMAHLYAVPYDDAALDAFAQSIGLRKSWRHGDHYDLSQSKRILAIQRGAVPIDSRKGALLLAAARRQKREFETLVLKR